VGEQVDQEKALFRRAIGAGAELLGIVDVIFATDYGARQRNDDSGPSKKYVRRRSGSDVGAILVTHGIPPRSSRLQQLDHGEGENAIAVPSRGHRMPDVQGVVLFGGVSGKLSAGSSFAMSLFTEAEG
jgi:hypothetical protein